MERTTKLPVSSTLGYPNPVIIRLAVLNLTAIFFFFLANMVPW